jgi:ABC-type glycerol-3-phosphate transport system substrate-binding protein
VNRRLIRILMIVATLTMVVGGCGDDDGGDGGGGGDQGAAPVEEGSLEGEELEVAAVWTGTEQDRFTLVLDAFEEQTGASVTFTSTGDDISAVLTPRISGGDPPDVAILPQPGLLREFQGQDALQPLDDVVGDSFDDNYAGFWRDLATVEDQLYAVPFKAANKSLIWYRPAVFEDAGVEPPSDYDGLLETFQTVSDFGVTPLSVGGADGWTLTDWFENVYLRTAGPEMYDQLAEHEIPWTDESVTSALETLAEVFQADFVAGGLDGAVQTDFTTSVTQVFAEEAAATVFEADFVAGTITGDTEAELGTDADVFPFPEIEGSGNAVVAGGDLAVLFSDSEAGRALIEYLGSPEAGEIWAEEGGFISPNQNVSTDAYPDEISQRIATALIDAGENARFDLSDLQPSEFGGTPGQGLWARLQDFLRDPSAIDQVTQQIEAAAARAYGE